MWPSWGGRRAVSGRPVTISWSSGHPRRPGADGPPLAAAAPVTSYTTAPGRRPTAGQLHGRVFFPIFVWFCMQRSQVPALVEDQAKSRPSAVADRLTGPTSNAPPRARIANVPAKSTQPTGLPGVPPYQSQPTRPRTTQSSSSSAHTLAMTFSPPRYWNGAFQKHRHSNGMILATQTRCNGAPTPKYQNTHDSEMVTPAANANDLN